MLSIYSLYQPTAPNFQKFLWLLRNKIDFGLNVFYMVNYYPERYPRSDITQYLFMTVYLSSLRYCMLPTSPKPNAPLEI